MRGKLKWNVFEKGVNHEGFKMDWFGYACAGDLFQPFAGTVPV
jgi:hypothetical protein